VARAPSPATSVFCPEVSPKSIGLSSTSVVIVSAGIQLINVAICIAAQSLSWTLHKSYCCVRTTLVAIFMGIDGGGSKTSCAVGDETSLLGSGTAAGSNLIRLGESEAREALAAAIRQACAVANVSPSQIQRSYVGLAGAARPEINDAVRRIVSELVGGEIEVVGDMVIALEAAFGDGPGVIVIAGTGSVAYGRNANGHIVRAGGWGFAISDEGSGHWIGRAAVSAALRAADEAGLEDVRLLAEVMKSWKASTHQQVVLTANAAPSPDFAALLPVVLAAADCGDPIARGILTQAGSELAALCKIAVRRLFPDYPAVPVAMSGGVFRNCALVRQVFYNSLRSEFPNVAVNATVIEPVRGALELARKAARQGS
jgi:glucosamine kinase